MSLGFNQVAARTCACRNVSFEHDIILCVLIEDLCIHYYFAKGFCTAMLSFIQMDRGLWILVCIIIVTDMSKCSCLMIGFLLVIVAVLGQLRTLTLCVDNLVLTLMVSHYQLHEGVF